MLNVVLVTSGVFLLCGLILSWRIARFIMIAKRKAKTAQPYHRHLSTAIKHILILGDSTMFSAGASSPRTTVGGLFASKYPDASVETYATNGAKVGDVPVQFSAGRHDRYDLVVIGVGANNIIRFGRVRSLRPELEVLLQIASDRADRVLLCHSANLGNIGFFPFPLNYFFDWRSRRLSELYYEVSKQFNNVSYVNFYRPIRDDHYDKQTRRLFLAEDAVHANDYANKYFFELLVKKL